MGEPAALVLDLILPLYHLKTHKTHNLPTIPYALHPDRVPRVVPANLLSDTGPAPALDELAVDEGFYVIIRDRLDSLRELIVKLVEFFFLCYDLSHAHADTIRYSSTVRRAVRW